MKRIALLFASVILVLGTISLVTSHATASDGCPGTDEGWIEIVVPEQARDVWDHWNLTEPVSEVCVGGVIFTEEKPSGPCIRVSGLGTNNVFIDRFCPGFNRFSYLLEIPPTATSTATATVTPTPIVTPTIPPTATSTSVATLMSLTSTPTTAISLATDKMVLDKAWIVPIVLVVLLVIAFAIIWIVVRNKKKK